MIYLCETEKEIYATQNYIFSCLILFLLPSPHEAEQLVQAPHFPTSHATDLILENQLLTLSKHTWNMIMPTWNLSNIVRGKRNSGYCIHISSCLIDCKRSHQGEQLEIDL